MYSPLKLVLYRLVFYGARLKIAIVYPEILPSDKARTVTVVKTAATLGEISDVTLMCEKSSSSIDDICGHYGVHKSFSLVQIPKKLLFKSNKIFNFFLIRYLRGTNYDAVYVRHLKTAEALIRKGFEVIFEAHEIFADSAPENKKKLIAKAEKYVYENSKGIVFISQTLKDEFEARFKLPPSIELPLCFSEQVVDADKKKFDELNEVYYIGSFQGWKGVDTLIKSAKYLPDGAKIKLIGSGGDEGALKNLAKLLDVNAKVEFLGRMTHAKVAELLKTKTKICVLPNNASAFDRFTSPLKLFEYMASFNAVVASDIPSIREIIGGVALEFKAGDERDLGEKISYLLDNDSAAKELAAASYVKIAELEPSKRAMKLLEFVRSIDG
jgi:glycosyltransferase involved in cell wall biosynthesis